MLGRRRIVEALELPRQKAELAIARGLGPVVDLQVRDLGELLRLALGPQALDLLLGSVSDEMTLLQHLAGLRIGLLGSARRKSEFDAPCWRTQRGHRRSQRPWRSKMRWPRRTHWPRESRTFRRASRGGARWQRVHAQPTAQTEASETA